jgi:hypothetical protein
MRSRRKASTVLCRQRDVYTLQLCFAGSTSSDMTCRSTRARNVMLLIRPAGLPLIATQSRYLIPRSPVVLIPVNAIALETHVSGSLLRNRACRLQWQLFGLLSPQRTYSGCVIMSMILERTAASEKPTMPSANMLVPRKKAECGQDPVKAHGEAAARSWPLIANGRPAGQIAFSCGRGPSRCDITCGEGARNTSAASEARGVIRSWQKGRLSIVVCRPLNGKANGVGTSARAQPRLPRS